MKVKIWTLHASLSDGDRTHTFGSETAAEARYAEYVTEMWSDWEEGEMPTDPHEAYGQMLETPTFNDFLNLETHEVDVPFPAFDPNIEAALCVWEWWQHEDRNELWEKVADGVGSPGMRMVAVQAGQIVLTVYDLMTARGLEFTYAYDFDFVPAVCEQLDWNKLVENNQYGDGSYRPDPAPLLDHMMRLNPNQFHDRWIDDAKAEAAKQWKYPALVDDHEDSIDRTETPAAWVKRIGEKHALTPAA